MSRLARLLVVGLRVPRGLPRHERPAGLFVTAANLLLGVLAGAIALGYLAAAAIEGDGDLAEIGGTLVGLAALCLLAAWTGVRSRRRSLERLEAADPTYRLQARRKRSRRER